MRESAKRLDEELNHWEQWAKTAVRDDEGWESDAPNWRVIMELAEEVLEEPNLQAEELALLELVFSLSEETESLADVMKERCYLISTDTFRRLVLSPDPKVRWQVYDSIINREESCLKLLEQGLQDADAYVRRRAFLRLMSHGDLSDAVLKCAAKDVDNVIRDQAKALLSRK